MLKSKIELQFFINYNVTMVNSNLLFSFRLGGSSNRLALFWGDYMKLNKRVMGDSTVLPC